MMTRNTPATLYHCSSFGKSINLVVIMQLKVIEHRRSIPDLLVQLNRLWLDGVPRQFCHFWRVTESSLQQEPPLNVMAACLKCNLYPFFEWPSSPWLPAFFIWWECVVGSQILSSDLQRWLRYLLHTGLCPQQHVDGQRARCLRLGSVTADAVPLILHSWGGTRGEKHQQSLLAPGCKHLLREKTFSVPEESQLKPTSAQFANVTEISKNFPQVSICLEIPCVQYLVVWPN